MNCPDCQSDNEDSFRYCRECGRPLVPAAAFQPAARLRNDAGRAARARPAPPPASGGQGRIARGAGRSCRRRRDRGFFARPASGRRVRTAAAPRAKTARVFAPFVPGAGDPVARAAASACRVRRQPRERPPRRIPALAGPPAPRLEPAHPPKAALAPAVGEERGAAPARRVTGSPGQQPAQEQQRPGNAGNVLPARARRHRGDQPRASSSCRAAGAGAPLQSGSSSRRRAPARPATHGTRGAPSVPWLDVSVAPRRDPGSRPLQEGAGPRTGGAARAGRRRFAGRRAPSTFRGGAPLPLGGGARRARRGGSAGAAWQPASGCWGWSGERGNRKRALRAERPMPKRGLEPPRPCGHMVLNHARLPFRHFGLRGPAAARPLGPARQAGWRRYYSIDRDAVSTGDGTMVMCMLRPGSDRPASRPGPDCFRAEALPEIGRSLGNALREFQRASGRLHGSRQPAP